MRQIYKPMKILHGGCGLINLPHPPQRHTYIHTYTQYYGIIAVAVPTQNYLYHAHPDSTLLQTARFRVSNRKSESMQNHRLYIPKPIHFGVFE